MDYTKQPPVILSFCTGGRMLEEGLERAIGDYTAAAYVEIECFSIFNLVAQMEKGMVGAAPIWTDAKTFDPYPFRGKIHIVIGGYPCQPFSVSGELKGTSDPRHLWPYLGNHVDIIRPAVCVFENVANHLNVGFEAVRADLQRMGYIVKAGIYSAAEVGAPHVRKRLFIVAVENTHYTGVRRWFKGIYQRFQNKAAGPGTLEYPNRCEQLPLSGCLQHTKEFRSSGHTGHVSYTQCTDGREMADKPRQPKRQEPGEHGKAWRAERWPARPGEQQYDWERPRVIKSGLGCTINGYNFREDLLRMYGNGVVPATAEHAIIDLLRQHFHNER